MKTHSKYPVVLNVVALLLLAGMLCSCENAISSEEIPGQGLVVRFSADCGIAIDKGRVSSWRDQSEQQSIARPPENSLGPCYDSNVPAVVFSQGTGLKIDGSVLPPEARDVTIIALAKADSPMSIGLFAVRGGETPLLQLDVEENGRLRFIARDTEGRTIRAENVCTFDEFSVFRGTLILKDENQQSRIEVTSDSHQPVAAVGMISPEIFSGDTWIGMLRIPKRPDFNWNGMISEVLVYDRILGEEEIKRITAHLKDKYETNAIMPTLVNDSWDVLKWRRDRKPVNREIETDVCIIGGGSGGIGAAIAAAREGADVVLVERQARLGGTGVNALVSGWEPGPGCSIAKEIYERMREIPNATGVSRRYPNTSSDFPMGQFYVTEGIPYEQSTRRAGVPKDGLHNVPYSPEAFDRVVREMLDETERVTLLDETTFFKAEVTKVAIVETEDRQLTNKKASRRVASVLVEDGEGSVIRVKAKVFIDCTGDVFLCRDLGCETYLGIDPKSRFNEPSAPEEGHLQLNAISRCYQVRPSEDPTIEPKSNQPEPHFAKCAHVTGWRDGVRVVNPLPMLPGRALIDHGYDECLRRSELAAHAHWRWLQQQPDFEGYELDYIAPMLGVRESYRVRALYMLCEDDLRKGLSEQMHEDIIAVADHPCDIHGAGGGLTHVRSAYGIPYRCLIPEADYGNLLVASRGAGMSRIAASSCRLQRTIIQLGHAAGKASAWAAEDGIPVDCINTKTLIEELDARSRCPWSLAE